MYVCKLSATIYECIDVCVLRAVDCISLKSNKRCFSFAVLSLFHYNNDGFIGIINNWESQVHTRSLKM